MYLPVPLCRFVAQWNKDSIVALAEDDDLHVGQHHQLHRHLSAAQHCRPQTGETECKLPLCVCVDSITVHSVFSWGLFFLQGGTLNKTTKRSGPAESDSDREPLTQGEEEPNNDEEDEAVRSNSINSWVLHVDTKHQVKTFSFFFFFYYISVQVPAFRLDWVHCKPHWKLKTDSVQHTVGSGTVEGIKG